MRREYLLRKAHEWITKARQDRGLSPEQKTKVRSQRNAWHRKVPRGIHSEPITNDTDGRQPRSKRHMNPQGYRIGQSHLRSGGKAAKRAEAARVLAEMQNMPKPKLSKGGVYR